MLIREYLECKSLKTSWLADKVNLNPYYVSQWVTKNKIPVKYWKNIVKITQGKVSYEDLWDSWTSGEKKHAE